MTTAYLPTGDDRTFVTVSELSTSRTTSTGCGGATAFHGLVEVVIATKVTVPALPADPLPVGRATAHAPALNLGAIGRP